MYLNIVYLSICKAKQQVSVRVCTMLLATFCV